MILSDSPGAVVGPGDVLDVAGQLDNLTVVCVVTGGAPPPSLTWWRDDTLIDTSFER